MIINSEHSLTLTFRGQEILALHKLLLMIPPTTTFGFSEPTAKRLYNAMISAVSYHGMDVSGSSDTTPPRRDI